MKHEVSDQEIYRSAFISGAYLLMAERNCYLERNRQGRKKWKMGFTGMDRSRNLETHFLGVIPLDRMKGKETSSGQYLSYHS